VELELQVDWPLELCGPRDFRRCSGLGAVFFSRAFTFCFTSLRWFFIGVLSFFKLGIFRAEDNGVLHTDERLLPC